ncbi:universal stress protein [Robertkochia flava]|uniref:universal stress protein n=1 Tax=Robertkochia flava TaxID=3447986 RepID=UPI001CCF741B|nr:universal stress protein [Robertkochia marina]
MKPIKKLLVALDLSEMDNDLLRYAAFLASHLHPELVVFVHNIKKYEISELFKDQLADIDLDQVISEELDEKVARNFKADVPTEVLISEDPYTEALINYVVQRYTIDLLLIGNKNNHVGSGIIADKLLRMVKCQILLVPENPVLSMDRVWLGTDFSAASRKSFLLARYLQLHMESEISVIHVYNVPIQFSPYLDKEEMIPRIEKHIGEKFRKFLVKVSMEDAPTRVVRGRNTSVAQKLVEEARRGKADVLVVADKGGNIFSSLLVGSVTDELFRSVLPFPLWVVK